MEAIEELEEVAFPGSTVRDTRVTQQSRVSGTETAANQHERKQRCGVIAMYLLHELRGQVVAIGVLWKLPPTDNAKHRQMQANKQNDGEADTPEDRSRDHSSRIANLFADIADVVIAQVGINRQHHSRS